jgi:hypothetical protein
MDAKEKARELVFNQFRSGINVSNYHLKHNPNNLWKVKKCALICVDEIIPTTFSKVTWNKWKIVPQDGSTTEWWKEVRKEIEKI